MYVESPTLGVVAKPHKIIGLLMNNCFNFKRKINTEC